MKRIPNCAPRGPRCARCADSSTIRKVKERQPKLFTAIGITGGLPTQRRRPSMVLATVKNPNRSSDREWNCSPRQGPLMVLLFCLLAAAPASAQELTGGFHPQKSTYLLGEPVWFVFEVTNKENVPVRIEYSNPYGLCAFGGSTPSTSRAR